MNKVYGIVVIILILTISLQNIGLVILGFNINITNVSIVCFLIFFVISKIIAPKFKLDNKKKINIITVIFITTMFISYIATSDLRRFVTFFGAILIFLVVGNYLNLVKEESWEIAAYLSTLMAVVFAIGHFCGYIPVLEFERASRAENIPLIEVGYTGLIPTRGIYGVLLIIGLAVSFFWVKKKFVLRILGLLGILLFSFAAIISCSRSTWLAFLVFFASLLLIYYFKYGKIRPRSVYYLLGLFVFIFSLLVFSPILKNFYTGLKNIRERSLDVRFEGYCHAIEKSTNSAIFGNGFQYTHTKHSVHNAFLAILMERGYINFFLYILLFCILIGRVIIFIKLSTTDQEAFRFAILLSGILGILIELNLFHGYSTNTYMVFLGLILGSGEKTT